MNEFESLLKDGCTLTLEYQANLFCVMLIKQGMILYMATGNTASEPIEALKKLINQPAQ